MKQANIYQNLAAFKPLMESDAVQAAVMVLKSGESSSEQIENEHPFAEQWLFVVSGKGIAKLGREQKRLETGMLIYIPKKKPHQITNTSRAKLVTLNFYSPPAYTKSGVARKSVSHSR